MTRYFIAQHVRFCFVDGGTVLLDLDSGKYFGIGPSQTDWLGSVVYGWRKPDSHTSHCDLVPDDECLRSLLQNGLVTTEEPAPAEPTSVELKSTLPATLRDDNLNPPIRATHVLRFIHCALAVRWKMRSRRLKPIVSELGRAKRTRSCAHPIDGWMRAQHLVSVFRRIRPWVYTAHNACLYDSLVLGFFLRSYGVPARLVLGVCTKPFLAHAWVQLEAQALDEAHEALQRFTPILEM